MIEENVYDKAELIDLLIANNYHYQVREYSVPDKGSCVSFRQPDGRLLCYDFADNGIMHAFYEPEISEDEIGLQEIASGLTSIQNH